MKKVLVQYGGTSCRKCGQQGSPIEAVAVEHGIEDVEFHPDRVVVNGVEGPAVFPRPVGFVRVKADDGQQQRGAK